MASRPASWHDRRLSVIRRLQEYLRPDDDCSFDAEEFGMTVDYRFGEGDSNRYADAFAVTVDTSVKRSAAPERKRRKRAAVLKTVATASKGNKATAAATATSKAEATSKVEATTQGKIRMALKVVPLDNNEACYVDSPLCSAALRHSVWTEYLAMQLCSELIEAQCTPCLPFLIRKYSCTQPFSQLAEKQKTYQPAIVLCNEIAKGGNLFQWAARKKRRAACEWHAILFHLFVAMYALQKYCGLTHHDLHLENVLLMETREEEKEDADVDAEEDEEEEEEEERERGKKREKSKYWQYSVDNELYYVPDCLGFIPILWDFGIAYRPEVCANESFAHVHPDDETERKCADASQLLTILSEMREDDEISIPASSWKVYETILSWEQFSLKCAIPFAFRRLFGRRPPIGSILLEPIYDCSRAIITPKADNLAPYFLK